MALYRRAGIYYVKLTSPDGSLIRRSLRTADRRKAQEAHDRLKAQLWDLHYLQRKPKRTWDEAALRWLQEKAYKRSYQDDVNRIRWFTTFLRGKTLDQISRDMIDEQISRRLRGRADRTKDLHVALIRAIFRKAMREWEWIETMPSFRTYHRGNDVRVRYLTKEQAQRVLDELPEHQRAPVAFALATGLRQGNILALSWDQIDFKRRILTVEGYNTKNGEALGIPLNDAAMDVLLTQKGKHPLSVFTYQGRPLRSANTKTWKNALKRAGIRDFRWHDLRHTWASWLRQDDVPTWVLQELGGWKSETMVRRYAHMSVKHLAPYADQLTFADTEGDSAKSLETLEAVDTKVDTVAKKPHLTLIVSN